MKQLSKRLMNWASVLDPATLDQAVTASKMPFVFPHIALMPDAHLGKGATVGSVIPALGAVMPAAVGVDIGRGMIAVRTQFGAQELAGGDLSTLRIGIESAIPLSAGRYNENLTDSAEQRVRALESMAEVDYDVVAANWRLQLGSLGSGNHFIEITIDEEKQVWLFLHSGSRGIGNKLAMRHIGIAKQNMRRWWISLPDEDLAYLVEGTDEFDASAPGSESRWSSRADQLPPQLHPARTSLRQGRVALAKGSHCGRGRNARLDTRLDGDGQLRRSRQRQRPRASLIAARCRSCLLAVRRAPHLHP